MSKTAKFAGVIMIATILSKVLGFTREIVMANYYGAGDFTDAYLVAINIPTLAIATIGSALATTFVPLYFEIKNKHGKEATDKFTNNVLNIVALFCVIVCGLGLIFTEELVKVFAMGFEGEKLQIATQATKVLIFGVIFLALSKLFNSYLQVKDNFTIPALVGIPYNIIIITSIVLSSTMGYSVLIVGTLLAMSSQLLFQIPFSYKAGYRYKLSFGFKDEYIKKMAFLVAPVLIGVAVNQLNILIDRTLASTIGTGAITTLNYANRLNEFIVALFVISIVTVIYPKLANISREDDKTQFIDTIVRTCNAIVLFVMPITVGAICLAQPIVKLLFERGAFTPEDTQMTATALALYSIGLTGIGLREIFTRIFYSLSDTKTPMINGSIAILMNIILNLILIKVIGYAGLALATSISTIIGIILLGRALNKKIGYFGSDLIIKTGIKSFIASIIMGVITIFVYNTSSDLLGMGTIQEALTLVISVGIGAISYGIMVYILKIEEIKMMIEMSSKIKDKILKR